MTKDKSFSEIQTDRLRRIHSLIRARNDFYSFSSPTSEDETYIREYSRLYALGEQESALTELVEE